MISKRHWGSRFLSKIKCVRYNFKETTIDDAGLCCDVYDSDQSRYLSHHLLDFLQPSMPLNHLFQQPPEFLDYIISFADTPKDLLNLALLTSKVLQFIIIPYHLEYRILRCTPLYFSLWEYLSSRPDLAARIRRLELLQLSEPENTHIIPKNLPKSSMWVPSGHSQSFLPTCPVYISQVFLYSLRTLAGLTSFEWDHPCPSQVMELLAVIPAPITDLRLYPIYDTVERTPRKDRHSTPPIPSASAIFFIITYLALIPPQCLLFPSRLADIELSFAVGWVTFMEDILLGATNLEKLIFRISFPESLNRLFQNAMWSRLRVLHIIGYFHVTDTPSIQSIKSPSDEY